MNESGELRWFLEGPLSEEVQAWFLQLGPSISVADQEERSDHYLDLRGLAGIGLKRRGGSGGQGAVEVKVQTTPPSAVEFQDGVAGYAETWVKTGIGTGDGSWVAASSEGPRWIHVRKSRLVRKLAPASDSWCEVPPGVRLEVGCGVELCKVNVDGADWYTFGLEAFGAPGENEELARSCASWWFASVGPSPDRARSPLDLSTSSSYPRWLASLRAL